MDKSTLDELGECFTNIESQHDQKECVRRADMEFEKIGRGVDRFVYALGDGRVVKFPTHPSGAEVNVDEAENYHGITEDTHAGHKFAEVYDVDEDGSWLVMERADVPDYNNEREAFERSLEESDVTQLYLARGGWMCHDMRPSNFGRKEDGDWVAIDYPHCYEEDSQKALASNLGIH